MNIGKLGKTQISFFNPPLPGTPPSVWYPIIPCLEPYLCLVSHPMSRTPPMSGTPSHVWNSTHVWNSIPCLELLPCLELHPCLEFHQCLELHLCLVSHPHPSTPIPSTPTPVLPPQYPNPHHLALSASTPSGPCCSCQAPTCPLPT